MNITLWEASLAGSVEMIKKLLKEDESIDVDQQFVEGNTALHAAASQDQADVAKYGICQNMVMQDKLANFSSIGTWWRRPGRR